MPVICVCADSTGIVRFGTNKFVPIRSRFSGPDNFLVYFLRVSRGSVIHHSLYLPAVEAPYLMNQYLVTGIEARKV